MGSRTGNQTWLSQPLRHNLPHAGRFFFALRSSTTKALLGRRFHVTHGKAWIFKGFSVKSVYENNGNSIERFNLGDIMSLEVFIR